MAEHDVLITSLMDKTGLRWAAVAELLDKGWRWVENIGEISRWEHPTWSISDRVI